MMTPRYGCARPTAGGHATHSGAPAPLRAHGFFQIHREYVVNLQHIREIPRRDEGREWEVKLEPPVNRVLPSAEVPWRSCRRAFEID